MGLAIHHSLPYCPALHDQPDPITLVRLWWLRPEHVRISRLPACIAESMERGKLEAELTLHSAAPSIHPQCPSALLCLVAASQSTCARHQQNQQLTRASIAARWISSAATQRRPSTRSNQVQSLLQRRRAIPPQRADRASVSHTCPVPCSHNNRATADLAHFKYVGRLGRWGQAARSAHTQRERERGFGRGPASRGTMNRMCLVSLCLSSIRPCIRVRRHTLHPWLLVSNRDAKEADERAGCAGRTGPARHCAHGFPVHTLIAFTKRGRAAGSKGRRNRATRHAPRHRRLCQRGEGGWGEAGTHR